MFLRSNLNRLLRIVLFLFITSPAFTSTRDTAHFYMKHSFDVQKYTLNLNLYSSFITPYPKDFKGKATILFRVDSTLNFIKLNAVNTSLQIDSVALAGISFTHSSDTLKVSLNRTYQPGELVEVRISFQHKNVTDNAFYASGGYVFTDNPPEGARKWFPCWDRPSDKALTDITVKVPLAARMGSTGYLSDSTIIGDTLIYHWLGLKPVATYLITLTGKSGFLIYNSYWHHLSNPNDSIPIRLYYKSGEAIGFATNLVKPLTNFYSEKFGDYPFEKIGFATLNSQFPWGGMENQSMVNLMPGGYMDEDLIAHEHSHQWFGDLITCGTWADIWLNEGFGTFCQKLWSEEAHGYTTYKSQLNGIANYYLAQNPGWPLYNPEWAIHTPSSSLLYNSAVIYDKGACVLHQLRYVLGDSLFFSVMNQYATDTNFAFKNAVTEDFISKVNQVTGTDYQWFFDEWVYAPNHPYYANTYYIDYPGNGDWIVTLNVEQVQTNTVFFTMPIEVRILFKDGSDTLVKGVNNVNPQQFQWTFSKEPKQVFFDPNRNILLKQATTIVGISHQLQQGTTFELFQNEPNPFYDQTTIRYRIPERNHVKISIINSNGRIVDAPVNMIQAEGEYRFTIDSTGMEPGIYFYQMEAGSFYQSRKMVVNR